MKQRWQSLPPKWEPVFADPLPKGIQDPNAGYCMTGAQNRARKHIARVMDAVIYAGKTYQTSHGQHEHDAAPIIEECDHSGGEPIGGVGGWHAAGMAFAHEAMGVGDCETWAFAAYSFF